MIFTQCIKDLQFLDEMETEMYLTSSHPIMLTDENTELLGKIREYQKYVVRIMAASLRLEVKDNEGI